jgi:hypothetical protein
MRLTHIGAGAATTQKASGSGFALSVGFELACGRAFLALTSE